MEIITLVMFILWFATIMGDKYPEQANIFLSKLISLVPDRIDRKVFFFTVMACFGFILLLALCFRS